MNKEKCNTLQGVNVYDNKLVNKTGFGCGCDITQEIAYNNCKTQILDYELLSKIGGIELDNNQEYQKYYLTEDNYSSMNNSLNTTFAGNIGAGIMKMAFGRNLDVSVKHMTSQLDIYEYGMTMILQKMYGLNLKPGLLSNLRDFTGTLAWNDINATGQQNRTDKSKIKEVFKKYGTHITTKAFYGYLYQYFLCREQNDWESSIDAQLKIGSDAKIPIPETDMDVNGKVNVSISNQDMECYKHSKKIEMERRIGGNSTSPDLKTWLASCTLNDTKSMAMLGYALNSGNSSVDNSGLTPLYELLNANDERRDAMKQALDEYITENTIKLTSRKMVVTDVYAKHFNKGENAPSFKYGIDGDPSNHCKYFKLDTNIFDNVKGSKKGSMFFYYSLGHAVDEAIVDIRFMHTKEPDGSEWIARGCNANEGVTGCLDDNVVAIKRAKIKNGKVETDEYKLISGFGVRADGRLKISKGTTTNFNWKIGDKEWYHGLVHDEVKCATTTDTLNEF